MARRKTDAEFRAEVKSLVGDEYVPLDKYKKSNIKIRFKHQKCGSVFWKSPSHFFQGSVCPKCTKQVADEAKRKNNAEFRSEVKTLVGNEYIPLDYYEGSKKKIRFKHQKCGLVFKTQPHNFLCGSRCPKCAIKEGHRKIRKTSAKFKAEIKKLTGGSYLVLENYINAITKIKIKHKKCGYVFEMSPHDFLRGERCPKCMYAKNGIKQRKTNAEFKKEVKELVGKEYEIIDEYQGATTKVRFKHRLCGNIFEMRPSNFLNGSRCPKCANKVTAQKLRKTNDKFKSEVKNLTDEEYIVLSKYKNCKTKVILKHQICGNTFAVAPNLFLHGTRCPFCNSSKGEKAVEKYLKQRNTAFASQFRISDCKDKKSLPFDFAVFNLDGSVNCLIEYQGWQHFINPFEWKKKKGPFNIQSILSTQKHDAMKLQYCKDHGIKLIRINHPQTNSESTTVDFIEQLVNRTLNKELHVV